MLDKDDLAPVLENMRQALMTKNVAAEIAAKLCNSVQESLIGQKLGSFTSVAAEAKKVSHFFSHFSTTSALVV